MSSALLIILGLTALLLWPSLERPARRAMRRLSRLWRERASRR